MSQLGNLEAGSRHDLLRRTLAGRPDEADFRDDGEGAFGYVHSYESSVPIRRTGPAGRAVRVGLPAALLLLPQSRYLASQGRHLRLGAAGDRPPRRRLRRRCGRWTAASPSRAASRWCSSASPAEYWPRPSRWACTRRSRHRAFSAIAPTTGICRASISCCSTSRAATRKPIARRPAATWLRRCASPSAWRQWASRYGCASRWCRGLTDDPANVEKIARFVAPMKNVEWVEVQPFHQLGAFKWKAMKLEYKHANTAAPTPDLVNRVIEQFRAAGCRAR